MKSGVLSLNEVKGELRRFVVAELYTDRKGNPKDEVNKDLLLNTFHSGSLPLYLVLTPDGTELSRLATGAAGKKEFLAFLRRGREAAKANN